MARKFSLAYLTVPGIEPVEQIRLSRAAGYDYVSLRTIPMGLPGEPQICLERDPQQFERIRQALKDYKMKLLDIELVRVREDLPEDYSKAFECGAALGATQVLSSVWTSDHAFAAQRYRAICKQAAEYGLTVNLEFPVVSGLTTLQDTIAMQDAVDMPNLKILMDMIYVHWTGVTPQDILALDPNRFGLIHLCDCPVMADGVEFMRIVRGGRAYCGEGVADLASLLRVLPAAPCSIELPNLAQIAQHGAAGHIARCLDTAKAYFAQHKL